MLDSLKKVNSKMTITSLEQALGTMLIIVLIVENDNKKNQRLPRFSLNLADMPFCTQYCGILKAPIFLQPAPLFFAHCLMTSHLH